MLVLALLAFPQEAAVPAAADALAQCADCHPAESASYAATGMARALEPLRPGEVAGFAPLATGAGFTYEFESGSSGARVVATFARASEAVPWRDSAPLAFAIGAGELDRAFALVRGGRLWLAPLEIVGKGPQRHAALAPAHAMAPDAHFSQPVTPECLGCHTDAPPPRAFPLNLVPGDYVPRGISCGGCHGGLAEHVRARAAELSGAGAASGDPIARERDWSRVARMERCAACHLQGDARIELDPSRLGPPPPGTPLLATRAVFVAREPGDEIGFVSHVQRLVLSRCYLESAGFEGGGLSCESCHDPHRSVFAPDERARVRGACARCHPDAGAHGPASPCSRPPSGAEAAADCAGCHMRRTGVFDVADVTIHDHWIRRRPPAPLPPAAASALRFPESPDGDWRVFAWPGGAEPEPAEPDAGLFTMALGHRGHFERALEFARRGEGERARELPMLHHVRGLVFERAGDHEAARRAYERALALDPGLAEPAINLGPLLVRLGEARRGRELLDGVIRRHPLADSAYRNRATTRLALEDHAGFRADVEAALKLRPDAALAQAYAKYLAQRGDAAGARRWEQEARFLDPRAE